jgi:hypothetical protein
MTSQIANRIASPSRGARLLQNLWRDWVGAALLLVVWTTLWTVFTAGVLAPASGLARRANVVGHPAPQPKVLPGLAAAPWVGGR